jgi:hypothetical protein
MLEAAAVEFVLGEDDVPDVVVVVESHWAGIGGWMLFCRVGWTD